METRVTYIKKVPARYWGGGLIKLGSARDGQSFK